MKTTTGRGSSKTCCGCSFYKAEKIRGQWSSICRVTRRSPAPLRACSSFRDRHQTTDTVENRAEPLAVSLL